MRKAFANGGQIDSNGFARGDHGGIAATPTPGKNLRGRKKSGAASLKQRAAGTRSVIGVMLESYLKEGSQPFPKSPAQLRPGLSITDAWSGLGSDRTPVAHRLRGACEMRDPHAECVKILPSTRASLRIY